MRTLTPYVREKELKELLSPTKTPAGKKVFVGDMTDLFGEWVPFDLLDRIFAVFAMRHDVVFQVLTKRPDRMAGYLTTLMGPNGYPGQNNWLVDAPKSHCNALSAAQSMRREWYDDPYLPSTPWPLPNVWLGTSIENQAAADERIPQLLKVPAAVRFLSMEPLLGAVNLSVFANDGDGPSRGTLNWMGIESSIDWVIIGGESGAGHRSMEVAWAESLRQQCRAAGVPYFFKQDSGAKAGMRGRVSLDLWETKEFPSA